MNFPLQIMSLENCRDCEIDFKLRWQKRQAKRCKVKLRGSLEGLNFPNLRKVYQDKNLVIKVKH